SFEQDLLGNSTTSVIKNLNISVLAVPKNVRFSQSKKILFAIDSLRLFSVKRFSRFLEIAKKIQSEVEFFSVGKKVEDLIEQQSQLGVEETEALEHVKFLYKSIQSNSVINEIKKEAKNYNADILVMVPQKYGFWDSLVHVSKTRIMATGLHIPLLILRVN
ncbi:MAG: universal stress protein, partial [Flavobacterium piscis]|nr:universal stress protein [Flavobacterium piscis]